MFPIRGPVPQDAVRDSPGFMEIVQVYLRVCSPRVAGEGGLHRTGRCFAGRDLHRGITAGKIRKLSETGRSDPEQRLI